jgi:5-methylcytosine-specific restriction enzyme A
VSLTTGIPVSDFSGGVGDGAANRFVEARGFHVVQLRERNPSWVRDELILALNLYLRHRASLPSHDSKEISELSRILNQLSTHLRIFRGERFRNPNGVCMKLMNFRRLDPQFPQAKGLEHGGRAERDIWDEFAHNQEKCSQAALTIKNAIAALESEDDAEADLGLDDLMDAEEGRAVTRLHRLRERSRKLIARKKQQVLRREGRLACEVCGFEYALIYGDRGASFIECHHIVPVHELRAGDRTKLADLRLVCANCHRMIHARRPWLTVEEPARTSGVSRIRALFSPRDQ